ncbi:type VII secretion integral membrane protein EccD [Saccharopolyspora sp. WRP15-2]|uniref:Type VII secretion integral membrane protein EccD n=1 Tax=Saccharopolyspora oryzae TaxID=2997343 RepID=A0ABT4V2C0_9PSEU|nr:type VII secretion integral membrane protein EccD [Saccharopolyspora oryzae]MDA3628107.1 type VII secretion integral membrane protein EccD [Saccharopolyspora oryzae]
MVATNPNGAATAQPAPSTQPGQSGEMCRLTICGPTSRVELAVPAHVPISDLMPTVLGHLDPALATSGLAHGGWVLQRLGEAPLNEEHGTAAAGLYDGDVLHLRPRNDQLPLADFDDLVDGIHTGLSARTDSWRPALTRRVCLALAALAGLLAVLVTTFAGSGTVTAISAGAVGLVLIGGGALLARLLEERGGAITLGAVGVVALGVAGFAMPAGAAPPADWFTVAGALAGAVVVAAGSVIARAALDVAKAGFLAVACGAVLTALGCVTGLLFGLEAHATAAVLVAMVLAVTRAAPQLATWLAGLVAEPVPTTAEEFQQGLDPLPSKDVLDRASVADAHLTAFLVVLGAVCSGALLVLTSHLAWDTAALGLVVATLLLLQARELRGIWHRVAALVPATAALMSVLLHWVVDLPLLGQLCVLVGLLGLAGNALAGAQVLPGRRLVPRWGRLGDILHWICALAVLALVLTVAGFYGVVASWL